MKNKSEVLEKFKEFNSYAVNATGKPIKTLCSDNGGEHSSKEYKSFLKKNGIVHQLSVPYNPAQNGVAERMNRTIMESARSMLSHAQMPNEFWAEAVNTSVYVRNRSPTTALSGIIPYECLLKKKPDVSNLACSDVLRSCIFLRTRERNWTQNLENQFSWGIQRCERIQII